jgi:hypothetical protein
MASYQFVKKRFRCDSLTGGFLLLILAELFFKPFDHPVAPIYLNFNCVKV